MDWRNNLNLGIQVADQNISILLYADDIAIVAENPVNMQVMLDNIEEWCNIWKMKINFGKTKLMEFRKKGTEKSIAKFRIGPQALEKSEKYKYLGIIFDEFLTFENNVDVLSGAGHRAVGALIGKYKQLSEMGYQTYTKCYNTSICPILDYGAEVWGGYKAPKIDNVQNKAMRVFLGVHKFTSNDFLCGDMGWYPSYIRRNLAMLRYWNRLLNMENYRLPKVIFEEEFNINGHWCQNIHRILKEIDLEYIYHDKTIVDLNVCKNKMCESFHATWSKNITKKTKLRTYCELKELFKCEKYVKLNLPRNQRSILAQIRSGTLPLAIEIGRFIGLKLEDRLCKQCNETQVETEYHFIFICPKFQTYREEFFTKISIDRNLSPKDSLKYLFDMKTRELARFCCGLLEIRRENEYN